MSKSKLNGVDPQDADRPLRRRHRAPVRDVRRRRRRTARSWSDAGVEGAHRFLRRLWTFAQARAETVESAPWPDRLERCGDAAVKAARRELHLTLKQATYDYERIQYNTVVSAGMKMLNALEAVPADAAGANALAARGPVDPAARALPGRAAHRLRAVGRARLRGEARLAARRAVAAGGSGRARAGRDRARAAGQRQAPRQAHACRRTPTKQAIEAAARASRRSRSTPPARRSSA